ncbi:GNAT family N-acetyltransferase [Virgibacillus kekensis]|uniref:GNAT family N-acetyltransferase n=1 Tax=Virgibacillus kekensis TaxID=202261 RepID=A0ABV9DP55_9BACI
MLFQNRKLAVRKMKAKDRYIMAQWLSDPAVLEFYEGRDQPFTPEKIDEKFLNRDDGVTRCMVDYGGTNIGYIQFYPLDEEERKIYGYEDEYIFGIDQFIGKTSYWNMGIGTLLVKSMVRYLIVEKNAYRVVMDPQVRNPRALRCYEKCGFQKVKLLPKRELHEGLYEDCWLIEYNTKGDEDGL